ncbi:MAG: RNA polymerase sigma factor SigJ [Streptosporangiales bacterium]|nr:RNA polymerase sigma factor SigJ [Streptosporangiales bacterium]MBO0890106.1 RNA polymerase sigma factor SigJ [Acidothermales bacterium]
MDPTQVFAEHRELLFSMVYNMLGSVADTEDVLQETWLSWTARAEAPDDEPVGNPRGYLVRIAVNQALARRAAISRRRETYVGPWLPEPLVERLADSADATAEDAADAAVRSEVLSMAVLVVLETLSPLERAVFVLHEVFGYAHTDIAVIVDRSPVAVRQLVHRAREHVHARRPRYRVDPRVQREVIDRLVAATAGGDLKSLLRILSPDVTMWSDGGGKVPRAGLRPVHGRDKVARFLLGVTSTTRRSVQIEYRQVNGDPNAVLFAGDAPFAVLALDVAPDGGQVTAIYAVGNPDKLTRVQ